MRSPSGSIGLSLKIGAALTALDIGAAQLASACGKPGLASFVYWPNTIIQAFLPCVPMDVSGENHCEGTLLNVVAFWASIPISAVIYSTIAFLIMRHRSARRW